MLRTWQTRETLSEGFIRKVFPAVVAGGNIHSGIIAGKLKGAIASAYTQRNSVAVHVHAIRNVGQSFLSHWYNIGTFWSKYLADSSRNLKKNL